MAASVWTFRNCSKSSTSKRASAVSTDLPYDDRGDLDWVAVVVVTFRRALRVADLTRSSCGG